MNRDYFQEALGMFNVGKIQWYGFKTHDDDGNKIPNKDRMQHKYIKLNDDTATMLIAKQINETFEDWISAAPEQWLWPHRRWGKSVVKDDELE